MSFEPVRFGADREMVGVLQTPDHAAAGEKAAFLLCKPFGTEAVRANMLYRALAMRLVREGCVVLSFDYHGTGESLGDGVDETLAHWADDVVTASAFLRARGATTQHWFGLGLGATLAALAAAKSSIPPARVVLWEPVENGRAYADKLRAAHKSDRERWYYQSWSTLLRDLREPEPALPGVVLGFDVGASLAAEIDALNGLPLDALRARGVAVTTSSSERPFPWMSNHAPDGQQQNLGAEVVPQEIVRAAIETVR
jgi:alpha-beta hydrolase superfamily lysophospholipase